MTADGLPPELVAQLDATEAQNAGEVAARADTVTITILDANGAVIGYAVFGLDHGDMLAVYYARSMVKVFGPMMMKQFFGVAEVMGKPLRVHVDSIRDIKAKARMFGATVALEGEDGDGIMQGIFSHGQ